MDHFIHKFCLPALLLGFCLPLMANDGVFYAQGNHLIPVKETVVELRKEVLKLKRMGDYMAVDVYFEFFNPGAEKVETVGFVTPPAMGDVDEEMADHPQVREFSAVVNGQALPFKVARMETTGFSFPDLDIQGSDFVYHFEVRFKPGLNTIHHHYQFRGGSSVEMDYDFFYRLTTGNLWANGEIGDFTLEIDMGERALFTLPWSFLSDDSPANWKLLGTGKMGKEADVLFETHFRSVYAHAGAVQFKAQHFHPDRDLGVCALRVLNQAYVWGRPDLAEQVNEWVGCVLFAAGDGECLRDLSVEQLRIMRNFLYARHGLPFNSKDLTRYFSQFIWYDPIPGLSAGGLHLESWEQECLQAIVAEEQRRK